jgi:DNA repair exonuclease SbcCD nuclease subunit
VRIAVASDLHLDSYEDDIARMLVLRRVYPVSMFDVAVMAGDLSNFRGWNCSWEHAAALLMEAVYPKPLVMVLGNHDWSHAITTVQARQGFDLARTRHKHLHILDKDTCELFGQRFVGFTNWYDPHPRVTRDDREWYDYQTISKLKKDIFQRHAEDCVFAREIRPSDVVVTHMLPHSKCVRPPYENSPTNKFFVSEKSQVNIPKAWIYGHAHTPYSIDNCHARPVGYAGELSLRVQNSLPRIITVE